MSSARQGTARATRWVDSVVDRSPDSSEASYQSEEKELNALEAQVMKTRRSIPCRTRCPPSAMWLTSVQLGARARVDVGA
jgi:hypothetical protein